MAIEEHLNILKQGVVAWNQWIKTNRGIRPDLRDADLSGLNLSSINLKEAWLKGANLTKANLQKAKLDNAYMRNANLSRANLTEASLSGTNLRHAILQKAKLRRAYLRRVDFSYADLSGADLSESVLEYSRFVDTNLKNANIKSCFIYGASVWNIQGIPKDQSNLIITPRPLKSAARNEPTIKVDNLELAQFIYLLLNYGKLRDVLNSITKKGVLILGRFGGGGLDVLHSIASKLREMEYLPIIFDFDRPEDRNYTETIKTLVGLSRFVIVDLSGPSVPQELYATVPHFKVPFIPIIEKGRHPYSLFIELFENDHVLRPIIEFESIKDLVELIPSKIIAPAEEKQKARQKLLSELFDS